MSFNMDDYVDVAERIRNFAERFPDGSLQSELTFEGNGWLCRAYAYRTADDQRPGIGHAFEPVPGKTPYTKDSEAMNAETSAWGRAIVALGFDTKKIASRQEVTARRSENAPTPEPARDPDPHGLAASRADFVPPAPSPARDVVNANLASDKQKGMIRALAHKLGVDAGNLDGLSKRDASAKITELKAVEEMGAAAVASGGGMVSEPDVPFAPTVTA